MARKLRSDKPYVAWLMQKKLRALYLLKCLHLKW